MGYSIIQYLRIKEAFAGVTKFDSVNKFEDFFVELFECSNRKQLYVNDDIELGYSVFVKDTRGLGHDTIFEASNTNRRRVFLLRIDGVLYKKDSKCDCALISEKEIIFLEFKTRATNRTEKALDFNYSKAKSQLLATVNDFLSRFSTIGIDLLNEMQAVGAIAVFNPTTPAILPTMQKLSREFLSETGVKLSFRNSKTLI